MRKIIFLLILSSCAAVDHTVEPKYCWDCVEKILTQDAVDHAAYSEFQLPQCQMSVSEIRKFETLFTFERKNEYGFTTSRNTTCTRHLTAKKREPLNWGILVLAYFASHSITEHFTQGN